MSVSVDSSAVADVLGVLEQIPAAGGYIIAMVGFSVFGWILAVWARSSQRSFTASQQSMQNVVAMGETLRESMRQDIVQCHEERRQEREEHKRVIAVLKEQQQQLMESHTLARGTFLAEAKEHEQAYRRALEMEHQLREELSGLTQTVSILTSKLEYSNSCRRSTDGSN